MKINKTKIKGILIIQGVKHSDNRGYLREILLEAKIKKVASCSSSERERDQRALNNNRARSFYIKPLLQKEPETKNPRNKGRETLARV